MNFKLRFDVALFSGLCMLLVGIGAGATEPSADSGKPVVAKGPVATLKAAAEFELIEYVPPATTPERAGSAPQRPAIPSSPEGAAAGTAEVEPNGTFATATALSGNNTQAHGNIFPAADVDFYSFSALAGDRIYAATMTAFDASGSGNSNLQLIASDGVTVIETDINDGTFNASSSSIAGALIPSNGTYYLRVAHNLATGTIRPYTLHLRVQTGAPAVEIEPNNSPATATPLNAAGHMTGTISAVSPGESDFYSLSLNAGDSVYLSLDMNPERDAAVWNGRLGFGLFGNPPSNQILLANDPNAGASAADPNSEAFFFTVKDAGTYYVYVDSTVATGLGANATYNLSVAVTPRVVPPGVCTTHVSTNVPQTILATGPNMVTSTITVPGNPRINDLDVAINLTHTFMQDLDVHLVSPAGNDNGLFTDIGAATVGGAQTLMDLVIDDEAALPPAFAMTAPFHIRPELAYRLSWFDGSDGGGTWTLVIRDDATGDGGTLNSWSITICEPPPPPSCPAGTVEQIAYSSDFESGDGGFTHFGVADEWERGLPSFAPITSCNSGTNCWKTDLDNTYDANSNQNLLSPNIDLTGLQPPVLVRWAQRYHMESASFDQYSVDVREVGGANPVRLFEWLDATMNNSVGNPAVIINQSSGWSEMTRRVDSLAGTNAELLFNLTSDVSVQLTGVAIDDVSVSACRPLSADLSITKTDGAASSIPGTPVTYTIVAANSGPDPAPATVADSFPAILSGCSWTCVGAGGGTCTAAGVGNINDAAVVLPSGASVTYTATCNIAASATGSLINTATVSSTVTDPTPANNTATDTNTLTPQADLAISKTNGVTVVSPGQPTVYTIVASNSGPSNAPGSVITDNFPASLTACSTTCVGAGGATCPAGPVAGNLNSVANLPVGGTATYTASCTVAPGAVGSISNTATVAAAGGVTDPNGANNSATDTDTVATQADLSISKTNGVATSTPGTNTVYTIVASNAGPSNAPGSTVSDTFPAACVGVTWTCVGAAGGTCTANGAGNINNVVNLPSGGSVTYTATCPIDPAAVGTLANTASVTTGGGLNDPNPANNSATDTDTLGVVADLAITKTNGVASSTPGTTTVYTIVASNAGPSNAPGSIVADTFPAACVGVTWTCAGAGGGTCTANGAGNINDTVNLPVGGSVTYSASCPIDPAAVGTLANTATIAVAGGVTDPNPANNSATDSDTLSASADLSITKVAVGVPTPVLVGSTFSYTLTVNNAGPSTATAVVVTDVLPATLDLVSNDCGAVYVDPTLTWTIGTLAPGATVVCNLNVVVAALGPISNTASLTSATTDPNGANNASTSTLTGAEETDMAISLTSNVMGNLAVGDTYVYTVTGTNNGPGVAFDIDFTLELSSKVSFVSSTCGAVLTGTTLTWTVPTLASGASSTCQITVVVVLPGDIQATASVTSITFDPDLSNNSADLVVGTGAIPVPTFGTLGLLLLGLLLGGLGIVAVRR